jgi:hypothetical protein
MYITVYQSEKAKPWVTTGQKTIGTIDNLHLSTAKSAEPPEMNFM